MTSLELAEQIARAAIGEGYAYTATGYDYTKSAQAVLRVLHEQGYEFVKVEKLEA